MKNTYVLLNLISFTCITIGFVSCDLKDLTNAATLYNIVEGSENEDIKEESVNVKELETKVLNTGNSDIDILLDEYENYVNQYNDYKERISDGDLTVIAEAPELLEKVHETKKKIENSKIEMTTEQIARMSAIIGNL